MKRFIFSLLLVVTMFTVGGVFGHPVQDVHAQVTEGLQAVGAETGLSGEDPRVLAARIINVVLGTIAMIMVIIMVYAGFLYMTAGGNSEQTEKALKYIKNAIIGVIIILISWAAVTYIISRLLEATQDGGGVTAPPSPPGGGFGGGGGSTPFEVKSITPQGPIETQKVIVKIVFNRPVDPASVPANVEILDGAGTRVDGVYETNVAVVRFTPAKPCDPPNATLFCFNPDSDYTVRVKTTLVTTQGLTLTCGGFAPACETSFHTGTVVDVTPPQVTMSSPVDGQPVPTNSLVDLRANVTDDVGVGYASFFDGGALVDSDAPQGPTPKSYAAHVQWDTAGIAAGIERILTSQAFDIDSGEAISEPVRVIMRPDTCFNGVKDGAESDVDCGGDPSNLATYCGACAGGACTSNTDCASGVCQNGFCVAQPIITGMDPEDGAVGNYVTITGFNFGTNGTVTFLGSTNQVLALVPQACQAAGVNTWSPTEVIIEVPPGAQSGPLRLTNSLSDLADTTNASPGPALPDFIVNDIVRAGICAADPSFGKPSDNFSLYGTRFGNQPTFVAFGDRKVTALSWLPEKIDASVPNIDVGTHAVSVNDSNAVGFKVFSVYAGGGPPEIVSIDPSAGPIGTYVTLSGRNFGYSIGTVTFRDLSNTLGSALADTNFPPACADGYWTDKTIVVKVPRQFTGGATGLLSPGSYSVQMKTAAVGAPASNEVNFAVNTDPLKAGICAIVPRVAPVGTDIAIHGEQFGSNGAVTYFSNANGAVVSWSGVQVASTIPQGAQSGPVTVTPSGGSTSNGYNIDVRNCHEAQGICSTSEECCDDGACRALGSCVAGSKSAMFAWRSSTGILPLSPRVVEECTDGAIPSPSPWDGRSGGNDVCVNAAISVRFTTKIEAMSIDGSFKVYRCTGSGSNPCAEREEVAVQSVRLQEANPDQDYVELLTAAPLSVSSRYQVVITTDVRGFGPNGANMEENANRCGAGNAYCFTFSTRSDAAPCAIGRVYVQPNPKHEEDEQVKIPYKAAPIAESDSCVVLDCRSYDWFWKTGAINPDDPRNPIVPSDGRANITNAVGPNGGLCEQTATTLLETGGDPVKVNAETQGVIGTGDLFINFIPPAVVDYGPNCDSACVNAAIWATFNVPLDPSSVHVGNVEVRQCRNQNCLEFVGGPLAIADSMVELTAVPGTSDTRLRFVKISPVQVSGNTRTTLLEPGRFYHVLLKGGVTADGIRSENLVPMSDLNHPEGFFWTFRVNPGEGVCAAERLDMAPTEKYEDHIGARQGFTAHPRSAADACSAKGQILIATEDFLWSSEDIRVATLLGDGQLDTGAELPPGCSGTCKLTGATGEEGKTARCENGTVETTNPNYCISGRTPSGLVCRLIAPDGTGGEECDDANSNNDDACNNRCLWNPVLALRDGGSCGNSAIDLGEDCDFGSECTGDPGSREPYDCSTNTLAVQCLANGGTCQVRGIRGCTTTCRNMGASAVETTTCGNGDVADGEDCDDGNQANGDGCSANCLHEGSSREIFALCGNGSFEPGEACEVAGGSFPPGCNTKTCIHTGTSVCTSIGQPNCCSNATVDAGEDCDDGNYIGADGCSPICLFEGSSDDYAIPSFCANGILETGEACEAPAPRFTGDTQNPTPGGDGLIDPFQIATIVGQGDLNTEGDQQTNINAELGSVKGTAIYGLRCGFTEEASCTVADQGLTSGGCCDARPSLATAYPPLGATDVCRNVLINGAFNQLMNEQSVSNNFQVAKRVATGDCPSGTTDVTLAFEDTPNGLYGLVVRTWRRILAFFGIGEVHAQKWCAGTVTGVLEFTNVTSTNNLTGFTRFHFTLDTPLDRSTEYRVRFLPDTDLADNANPAQKLGIQSKNGVVAAPSDPNNGPLVWTFTTGETICTINAVEVVDETIEHPYFWNRAQESHPFTSQAHAIRNGASVPLSPINNVYDWEWRNWVLSNNNIARLDPAFVGTVQSLAVTSRNIIAKNVSGSGYVSARVLITADSVSDPSTIGNIIEGTAPITILICENPWPSVAAAPFSDIEGSFYLKDSIFEDGPFFNFTMTYCRDAGVVGPNEDLPGMSINPVAPNPVDTAQGILRQYLFTFREPELRADAIGVRIASNPLHLSPEEWYRSKGFTGNPQSLSVDGYEAVRDGRTVYIATANTDGPRERIFSNIFLISYNEGAENITREIYDKLLASLAYNINIQEDVAAACEDESGDLVVSSDGLPVACSADWECDKYGPGLHCANFKAKLQRDMMRIHDFQEVTQALNGAKARTGSYPELSSGSFLPNLSTSLWSSWSQKFTQDLFPQGGNMPVDPVNRFNTCGRCSGSRFTCINDTDCPTGESCASTEGYDPTTCWDTNRLQFQCPVPDTVGVTSHFYQYRSLTSGERFELASDFEVPPPTDNPAVRWWSPPLSAEAKQCVGGSTDGNFCETDANCRSCPGGVCNTCSGGSVPGNACSTNVDCPGGTCRPTANVVVGSCRPAGGQYRYQDICAGGSTYGNSSTCGDGVIDADPANKKCLGGSNDGKSCTAASQCPAGTCEFSEICETSGPTASKSAACTTLEGAAGNKLQTCLGCRQYVDDLRQAGCFAKEQCGNGRVDNYCNGDNRIQCNTDQNCKDRVAEDVQRLLALIKRPNGSAYTISATGIYDSQTTAAVRVFQQDVGITVDGKFGSVTKGKMEEKARLLNPPQCVSASDCFEGYAGWRCDGSEECDDGELNGTYGNCNLTCSGFGSYCGDSEVAIGESCDEGSNNGVYCGSGCQPYTDSCNLSCNGPSNFCGDGRISTPETCDGNTQTYAGTLCGNGPREGEPCETDANCGWGTCGRDCSNVPFLGEVCINFLGNPAVACTPGYACAGPGGKCSNDNAKNCIVNDECGGGTCLKQQGKACGPNAVDAPCGPDSLCLGPVPYIRTRTCKAPGTTSQCTKNDWASTGILGNGCAPAVFCGNGAKDEGEQCDDGNFDNTDSCTQFCTMNICGDGFMFEDVEECDLGDPFIGGKNSLPCNTAEYSATCTSCTRQCKIALTQGGFCGDGIKQEATAEQCDTGGNTTFNVGGGTVTCKALGFDYARALSGSTDLITCNSSCSYTGCAYCGDVPGDGVVGGKLLDTLFQQPVLGARVTLIYRGLSVDVQSSDDKGNFLFTGLDTHVGCNQYKIIVDSYIDNPLTEVFDESKRGGYLPVEIGPFAVKSASVSDPLRPVIDATVNAKKGVEINIDFTGTGSDPAPQINMIPRLRENEYIVQLWWNPKNGYNETQADFRAASDKNDFYAGFESELVDLVVRTPYTYSPGTFGRCSLPSRPEEFNPEENDRVGRNQGHKYWVAPLDDCASASWSGDCTNYRPTGDWTLGDDGVDHVDDMNGMNTCTNKIRATFSKTCTGGNVPADLEGKVGCTDSGYCRGAHHGFNSDTTCSGAVPEPSRQGSLRVFDGEPGAYLFCYHPEWDEGAVERTQPNCSNFILPPQSVFITGRGGVYDILVSRYRLFESKSHKQKSIRYWLDERNAELQVYDQYGLFGVWNFDDINAGEASVYGAVANKTGYGGGKGGWSNWDLSTGDVCTIPPGSADSATKIFYGYANTISPIWTPISIDTTNKKINEWNAGFYGADFRYFADIPNRVSYLSNWPGGNRQDCWERTCSRVNSGGVSIPPSGTTICGGPGYGRDDAPACDQATKDSTVCRAGSTCKTDAPNNSVVCVKKCAVAQDPDTNRDETITGGYDAACDKPSTYCGGIAASCNVGSLPSATR